MNGTLEPVGALALGLRVEAGQVLYVMTVLPDAGDRASLLAEQAREKASLAGLQARVKQAQKTLTRAKALNANDQLIATREVEAAEAELAEAKSRLEASRAAIAALSFEGEGSALRVEVKSPIAGEIAALHVMAGQVTSDLPLIRVIDRSELLVAARVVETDLIRLSLAGRAEVRTDGGILPARHVFTGPAVDPVKRTVDVLYAVEGQTALWLNQFVTLALPSGLAASGLAVPQSALVDIDGRPVVWVKRSAETFAPVGVRVVANEGGFVAVEGELAVGDRVVTSGMSFLRGARPAGPK
jgi:RND family efflux transporter MFP subunit